MDITPLEVTLTLLNFKPVTFFCDTLYVDPNIIISIMTDPNIIITNIIRIDPNLMKENSSATSGLLSAHPALVALVLRAVTQACGFCEPSLQPERV